MKPGRELDALVAEKVFGAVVSWDKYAGGHHPHSPRINTPECPSCGYDGHWDHDAVPDYSTDISAAFGVVEKLKNMGLFVGIDNGDDCYGVTFAEMDGGGLETLVHGEADTAPHAICLAALKAVGAKVTAPVQRVLNHPEKAE